QHEVEIFSGKEHEAAESAHNWQCCEKNPGHEKFVSVQDFLNLCLPRLQSEEKRMVLESFIHLTVRLRMHCTSFDRPDDDEVAEYRGTPMLRSGTGCIRNVEELDPEYRQPCFCDKCNGDVPGRQWEFYVQTARHVVFNEEEAKRTKVDLFYDDERSLQDGRMKSVWGIGVSTKEESLDLRDIYCFTCDEDVGEFLELADLWWSDDDDDVEPHDLSDLGLLPPSAADSDLALVVSHPHGQPKKITLGELRYLDEKKSLAEYNTPTCPGSSGAKVFAYDFERNPGGLCCTTWVSSVHSGSYGTTSIAQKHPPNLLKRFVNNFRGCRPKNKIEQVKKLRRSKSTLEQLNYGFQW
ncbi:hypothetical protein ElyMa_003169900, partial [Elysia marginata]